MADDTSMQKTTKPILGAVWGVFFGLGLALIAINSGIIEMTIGAAVPVVILGIALGVLWSLFGPAKRPKGASTD